MNFRGLMNKKQKERNFAAPSLLRQRKGQGLSVNAIILIILGLVVLVMLILGFVLGWDRVLPFISKTNVDTLKTACSVACSTSAEFDFCSVKRELKSDTETLNDVTCNYLLKEQPKYGIESCSISCDNVVIVETTEEEILSSKCSGNEGKTVQTLVGNVLQTFDCPTQATG